MAALDLLTSRRGDLPPPDARRLRLVRELADQRRRVAAMLLRGRSEGGGGIEGALLKAMEARHKTELRLIREESDKVNPIFERIRWVPFSSFS